MRTHVVKRCWCYKFETQGCWHKNAATIKCNYGFLDCLLCGGRLVITLVAEGWRALCHLLEALTTVVFLYFHYQYVIVELLKI